LVKCGSPVATHVLPLLVWSFVAASVEAKALLRATSLLPVASMSSRQPLSTAPLSCRVLVQKKLASFPAGVARYAFVEALNKF